MILTAQKREWQRESDARTLAKAEQIKSDKGRLKGATTAAKKMAKESADEAKAMNKIARKAPKGRTPSRVIPTGKGTGDAVVRSNTSTPLSRAKRK